MDSQKLHTEQLVVLPKRFETDIFSFGSFNNAALVVQANANTQIMGIGVLALQSSTQSNEANVDQSIDVDD